MPLAVPAVALVRLKLPVARPLRSSVLAPVAPSTLPASVPPLAIAKVSAPAPPVRLAMPLKFVVPTPSLTVPALAALTV